MLNWLCEVHFGADRTSFVYSAVFFVAGGLIYLYRIPLQKLADRFGFIIVIVVVAMMAVYYTLGAKTLIVLLLYGAVLVFALREKGGKIDIMANPFTKLISSISMEIYLSHMVVFRLFDMVAGKGLMFLDGKLAYAVSAVATVVGTIVFAWIVQRMILLLKRRLKFGSVKG